MGRHTLKLLYVTGVTTTEPLYQENFMLKDTTY
jgi:hypothetical protein